MADSESLLDQAPRPDAQDTSDGSHKHAPLSVSAFVLVMALLMASNALATDIMLPAFPEMGVALGTGTTAIQATITAYLVGFGLSQFFIGFLADRYGRKPVLMIGLTVYTIAGFASAFAPTLDSLLALRVIQGIGAGAPRVIVGAAVRDCYSGRRLAKVLSLVATVFLAVPLLAPAVGQLILIVADWHWVLAFLGLYGLLMLAICALYLPETLAVGDRRPIRLAPVIEAIRAIAESRQTVGYSVGAGVFFGSLFGFIATSQQLIGGTYEMGKLFAFVFAAMVAALSLASFVNAMLVERLGMRLLSHLALTGFVIVSATMLGLQMAGLLGFWPFAVLQAAGMLLTGLMFANFNALAMEPQGRLAGIASSFVSAVTILLGAAIGYFIGQAFDETAGPLAGGYLLCGLASFAILWWTERGRLFHSAPA